MSPPPPRPHIPQPLHYPGGGAQVGHRLRPGVIAAIMCVVILLAVGVTLAIVVAG
ncbi:hypothetical protein [Mycobacterium spongiae]|uniref:Uncharacterized protein n=1 Tax=Mycobacterium spongiae TaxID=886343 RepID=A0A975JYQ3_9MYCO|nr:hypothetical protein [Mycobacterium spongiae]QUR68161.1 hypothetical protein F6B93_14690 [Mycobacterium spongiae]